MLLASGVFKINIRGGNVLNVSTFWGFQNVSSAVTESLNYMSQLSIRPAGYQKIDETLTISMAIVITKPSDREKEKAKQS